MITVHIPANVAQACLVTPERLCLVDAKFVMSSHNECCTGHSMVMNRIMLHINSRRFPRNPFAQHIVFSIHIVLVITFFPTAGRTVDGTHKTFDISQGRMRGTDGIRLSCASQVSSEKLHLEDICMLWEYTKLCCLQSGFVCNVANHLISSVFVSQLFICVFQSIFRTIRHVLSFNTCGSNGCWINHPQHLFTCELDSRQTSHTLTWCSWISRCIHILCVHASQSQTEFTPPKPMLHVIWPPGLTGWVIS